jgi:hypothetical protein
VQAAHAALSSLHSKLEPLSLEEKAKLAAVEVVLAAGPLVIEVCGGVVSPGGGVTTSFSTVQLSEAGVVSTFLAGSIARTENW